MRAQSRSRTLFLHGPCEITEIRETDIKARAHSRQTRVAALTGVNPRVWLRRRFYWLRCRIVNANGTQGECRQGRPPAAGAARARQEYDPRRRLRPAVARRGSGLFRAETRALHGRRPDDRAASFRLERGAAAAHRRPGARYG